MKPASPALQAFLASLGPTETCKLAELYTFTLTGGLVLRYTTSDIDVAFEGTVWLSSEVRFQDPNNRALGHWKIGLDVDSWQVLVMPRAVDVLTGTPWPDQVGNMPFLSALWSGMFDNADVEVDYAFFDRAPAIGAVTWSPVGIVQWFRGLVAECDVGSSAAVMTFNDYREKLTTMMSRRLFGGTCRFALYGPDCSLSAAAFTVAGTVDAGSSQSQLVSTVAAPSSGQDYALGFVTMTSGANSGFKRAVRSFDAGTFNLTAPFYWPISAGDTFTATLGCQHTEAACTALGNHANFGGQSYIPVPELAV